MILGVNPKVILIGIGICIGVRHLLTNQLHTTAIKYLIAVLLVIWLVGEITQPKKVKE